MGNGYCALLLVRIIRQLIETILLVDPRVVRHGAGEEALHEGLAADAGDVRPDAGHRGRRDQDQGQGRPHRGDHLPLTGGDCAVPTLS